MKLKELIEAYISLSELQEQYSSDFMLIDVKSGTNYNTIQYIKEILYVKITDLYPEFLKEPFIINEYIVVWSKSWHSIKLYPKKEIK